MTTRHRRSPRVSVVAALLAIGFAASAAPAAAAPQTPYGVNLVKNPGAEGGPAETDIDHPVNTPGWFSPTFGQGPFFTVVKYGAAGGFPGTAEAHRIHGGRKFFSCGANPNAADAQIVDIGGRAAATDTGHVRITTQIRIATFALQDDSGKLTIKFQDSQHQPLGSMTTGNITHTQNRFHLLALTRKLPTGTRFVVLLMAGTRVDGGYCDAYFDKVSMVLTHV